MKKVKAIFLAVIVLAILAVGVGFFVTYYNPSAKKISRFCLRYDTQTITDTADIAFPRKVVAVQAKHVFEFAESDTSFTVKIVPNPKADFEFKAGDTHYRFADVEDLTPAFNVVTATDGFTIDLTRIKTPQEVLAKLFLGAVTLPQELKKDYYFTLVVTSAMGEAVTINFNTEPTRVTGIELSPDNEEVFYF